MNEWMNEYMIEWKMTWEYGNAKLNNDELMDERWTAR